MLLSYYLWKIKMTYYLSLSLYGIFLNDGLNALVDLFLIVARKVFLMTWQLTHFPQNVEDAQAEKNPSNS